jgi:uncharacterized membrane protein
MPCPYATALGKRGEGVHARRFLGFAVNDTLATIVVALVTSLLFNISFLYSFVGWFVLGEVLHYVYGVDTRFMELLGVKPCEA